jgi:glycosyltransferase involved in cell wall biosynthesis
MTPHRPASCPPPMQQARSNVTIIKSTSFDRDPRLPKELTAIHRLAAAVTFIGWNREGTTSTSVDESSLVATSHLFPLSAPYGMKVLAFLPFWWAYEFLWLLRSRSDLIHAINFDTLPPALIISKCTHVPIIYEMYDTYAHMNAPIPRPIRWIGMLIDRWCMRYVDAVIVVDESRIEEFGGIPNAEVIAIYNSPPDTASVNREEKPENQSFTIFFAGLLNRNRSLEEVIAAVLELSDVKLVVGGFGELENMIREIAVQHPEHIEFLGKMPYSEVLRKTQTADLIFSLYDPCVPLYRYASSNKLFEAMMGGKPILVSEGTSMAHIVRETGCGLVVQSGNAAQIKAAIERMKKNRNLGREMGNRGRIAYEQFYTWDMMSERLQALYHKLLTRSE